MSWEVVDAGTVPGTKTGAPVGLARSVFSKLAPLAVDLAGADIFCCCFWAAGAPPLATLILPATGVLNVEVPSSFDILALAVESLICSEPF